MESVPNKKKYPVWQLMDGTVVIQSDEPVPEKILKGQFGQHPTFLQNIRHQLLRFLERI